MNKKETFKIEDKEYAVVFPGAKESREAQKAYNTTFASSIKEGCLLRESLDKYMKEQGLWGEEEDEQYKEILKNLNDNELKLQRGGIKLSEARTIAIEMREKRLELQTLLAKRNALDINTAEGQAENTRFNTLVSLCLVYNDTGKPVYKNLDDYIENANTEVAFTGAQLLANITTDFNKNFEHTLPENKFLKKWKFADEELRLVNKNGHLVSKDGKLINENGHYVDENNNLVDVNGKKIDEDGNYLVEKSPFLDDDGKEIAEPVVEEATETVNEPKEDRQEGVVEEELTSSAE